MLIVHRLVPEVSLICWLVLSMLIVAVKKRFAQVECIDGLVKCRKQDDPKSIAASLIARNRLFDKIMDLSK